MDVSNLYSSAIAIECQIPADVEPVLYNLIVGFNHPITQEMNLKPHPGSWQGKGSLESFYLFEANAIHIPWIHDPHSSDIYVASTQEGYTVNPFTMMQVTDTHFSYALDYIIPENWLWKNDTMILSPDVIVLSGDLMDQPATYNEEYELAYNEIVSLHMPIMQR